MKASRRIFQVDPHEINYLRVTLESYDGMAVVRTIDPQAALIEIHISPGCEDLILEVLHSLVKEEAIRLQEKTREGAGRGG